MPERYFEDFQAGDRWEFDAWSLTEDEIVAFARLYDPQPIHLDPAAAAATPFGGLIASGWQTTLECVRRIVEGLLAGTAALGSPGVDELRWRKPVRPGEPVTAGCEVERVEDSRAHPERGRVHFRFFGLDQQGGEVMTARGFFYVSRRPGGAVPPPQATPS